MIKHNKVMCVQHQQNSLAKLKEMGIAIASLSDDSEDETTTIPIKGNDPLQVNDVDDSEVDSNSETETKVPLAEPLSPEKSFPIAPANGSRKSNKSKKSVRFDQSVTCRPSLHKKNYTPDETAAAFYSRREFEMIRRDLLQTLSLMQAGKLVEVDDDSSTSTDLTVVSSSSTSFQPLPMSSSRGLENFTAKGSLKSNIKKLRQKAITNVLVEQDFQVEQAEHMKLTYLFYDDEAIRDCYKKSSKIAAQDARKRGITDHQVASGLAQPTTHGNKKNFNKQSLRKMFFSKSSSEQNLAAVNNKKQQPAKQRRRWSSFEKKNAVSEKKITTGRWASLRSSSKGQSPKPNSPAAMIA